MHHKQPDLALADPSRRELRSSILHKRIEWKRFLGVRYERMQKGHVRLTNQNLF